MILDQVDEPTSKWTISTIDTRNPRTRTMVSWWSSRTHKRRSLMSRSMALEWWSVGTPNAWYITISFNMPPRTYSMQGPISKNIRKSSCVSYRYDTRSGWWPIPYFIHIYVPHLYHSYSYRGPLVDDLEHTNGKFSCHILWHYSDGRSKPPNACSITSSLNKYPRTHSM